MQLSLCRGKECDLEITLPATMVPHEDAQKIETAIRWCDGATAGDASAGPTHQSVLASFGTEEVNYSVQSTLVRLL